MRRTCALFGLVLLALLAMGPASAHPLGNFTTNVHLGLAVDGSTLGVLLVVDMAEIPTFREEVGDGYAEDQCEELQADLSISLRGARLLLTTVRTDLSFLPGAGGLDTLRLECQYESQLNVTSGELSFENAVYADRIGWSEIVVVGADSELPESSSSGVLTNYPPGEVSEVREGRAVLTGGSGTLETPTIIERVGQGLARGSSTLALLAAVGLGVGHAAAPGHGKTLMAAYLVGRRGGVSQALLLGLAVAVSHTFGVGVLGVVTAVAASQFRPEAVYPWLSAISAGIVTAIGLTMLFRVWRRRSRHDDHNHGHDHDPGHDHAHDHGHDQDHDHDHRHGHGHGPEHDHDHGLSRGAPVGWRSLAALGLAGGLVPSASAVVLLLGGISQGEAWWGLVLVAGFGIGMAATLVGAGLLVVYTARLGLQLPMTRRLGLQRFVPAVAAVAVTLIGIGLMWQAAASI